MILLWFLLIILLIYTLVGLVIGAVVLMMLLSDEEWRNDHDIWERSLVVLMTMIFWPQMFRQPPVE